MKIAIGSDHAGFQLKERIKIHLKSKGIEFKDYGCYSEERVDYPDFAHAVATGIINREFDYGILMCGSGNGINMAANKHRQIRSALCWTAEIAQLARSHNDANILTLPGRYIAEEEAKECVDVFLNTPFEGGRHTERVKKIAKGC
ncbi:MAG: ribose 5-phosphate isomerase B [Bacteroidetes bacterium]|nr:ribose 5-phosphate isomerase B [Bacteroidota bacterium]